MANFPIGVQYLLLLEIALTVNMSIPSNSQSQDDQDTNRPEVIFCPNCDTRIENLDQFQFLHQGLPRFQWWVAPLNLLIISSLLLMYNLNLGGDNVFPWSIWAISGIWLVYGVGTLLTYRPHDAWIIVPVFFGLLSLFLVSIDWASPSTSGKSYILGLTWSYIPVITMMVFLVILPIVTSIGRVTRSAVDQMEEIINIEESQFSGGK